jgi:HEAT repeat protein
MNTENCVYTKLLLGTEAHMSKKIDYIDALILDLSDTDHLVRENAAYLLGEAAEEATRISENTLKTSDQMQAMNAILNPVVKDRVQQSLILALSDTEAWVRGNAADALGKLMDNSVLKPLITVLSDKDRIVRLTAVDALRKLGDPSCIESLESLVNDPEWSVRLSVAKAVSEMPGETATKIVSLLSADSNQDVRKTAFLAHQKIERDANIGVSQPTSSESTHERVSR